MRSLYLLLLAATAPSVGCSALVASAGKDLGTVTTRDQAREEFGAPSANGTTEGESYDVFRSRRKVAEPIRSFYLCMGFGFTAGLGEVVWFPSELYRNARRVVVGQALRFTYDTAGNVTSVQLDGERVAWTPPPDHTPQETAPADPAGSNDRAP